MLVVIPCWRRPAHLLALLKTIERARGADKNQYLFAVDAGASSEITDVIDGFSLSDRIAAVVHQGIHEFNGPAYNILRAWAIALALSDDHRSPIGLLEEDLLISEDLFEFWADALVTAAALRWKGWISIAGVSACRNQNLAFGEGRAADPSAIYAHRSYQSLAVAMRRSVIEAVLKHATPRYFADPQSYVEDALPDPGLPRSACSQDALFHRVIRQHDSNMIYPLVPRACHVGWYGSNRPGGWSGSMQGVALEEQAEWILAASADQMNALADPRFRDIERCDLIRARTPLKLI